ncbi:hypothetical protein AAHB34_16120 [Paenarthrobacter ureafaciens]
MADINALVAQVTALEGEITGTTNYDGHVPTKVPEAGGYILPYFVNWFGTGDNPDEVTSDGNQPTDSLIWDFQITAVASNAAACRSVAQGIEAEAQEPPYRERHAATQPGRVPAASPDPRHHHHPRKVHAADPVAAHH